MALSHEDIARVAHEANRAYQIATGDPAPSPHWEDAPDWQRDSAAEGVQHALDGETPEELHDRWAAHKAADGWVHGEVKDGAAKTHPCLVPYAELPEVQRVKDDLFAAVVMVTALGPPRGFGHVPASDPALD